MTTKSPNKYIKNTKYISTGEKIKGSIKGYTSSRRKMFDETISDITSIPFAYLHQNSKSIKKLLHEANEILTQAIGWTVDEKDPKYSESNGIKNLNIFTNLVQECVRICKETLKRASGGGLSVSGFDDKELMNTQNLEHELLIALKNHSNRGLAGTGGGGKCENCEKMRMENLKILKEIRSDVLDIKGKGFNTGSFKHQNVESELEKSKFLVTENFENTIIKKINDLISSSQQTNDDFSLMSNDLRDTMREVKMDIKKLNQLEKLKSLNELEGLKNLDLEIIKLKQRNEEMMNQLKDKLDSMENGYRSSQARILKKIVSFPEFKDTPNFTVGSVSDNMTRVCKSKIQYDFKEDELDFQNEPETAKYNTIQYHGRRSNSKVNERKMSQKSIQKSKVLRPIQLNNSPLKRRNSQRNYKINRQVSPIVGGETSVKKSNKPPTPKGKSQDDKENSMLNENTQGLGCSDFFKLTSISQIDGEMKDDTNMINSQFLMCDSKVSQHFGDKLTTLALKDHNSYLVVQEKNGYSLVNNGEVIKFGNKGKKNHNNIIGDFRDVAFSRGKYFIYDHKNKQIQVKLNDLSEMKPHFSHEGCGWTGRTIRVDKDDDSYLLLNKNYKGLVCYNTETNSSFHIYKKEGQDCDDFATLGQSRLLLLTEDGSLLLYHYDKVRKASRILSSFKMKFEPGRNEKSITLAVCPKDEIVAVNTRVKSKHFLSKVLLFRIMNNYIEKISEVDLYDQKCKYFYAMNFHGYRKSLLILSALTSESKSKLFTFVYDGYVFEELRQKRKKTESNYPRKLQRVQNVLIGADNNGKLFKIKYN